MDPVNQLASSGTFRVLKEPLAFLRALEWVASGDF
uniref:Synaptoporin n=1 Tax=Vombatus ursinus TaxID=29139 RepID=A0A4X2KEN4_VOMUR